ncbi:hypothetical protein HYPSUDRAFT_135050 [Hypholoma sublateritium FD-334 SS-4]|uniref:Phosphatidylglycerol lysyltransferase C-terminal domain-containing protein n=1 Tax=Hypholoma sublateritium (strain FD-334 SS-4) TaxID=945553 RepID=A0A0D2Q164_HYPSF|nr:hypothetical protein HYPSUDRAFT_135050 [Hypholoma sublateritium FD-334 SS-4]
MTSLEVPVPHHAGIPPTTTSHFTWAGSAADPSRSPSVSNEHVRGVPPPPGVPSGSGPAYHSADNEDTLADLIAKYGNASSHAWLDTERYKIWRSSQPIPESAFTPAQGYFQREHYAFAWGNPLVSSPAALEKTARAFIAFAEASRLHPIWCCVDHDLEAVLASPTLGWATMSCIYEDVLDPAHVVELIDPKLEHHTPAAEHLMKSLANAEKGHVAVHEVKYGTWKAAEREAVEAGIKESGVHSGIEFRTMAAKPWLDEEHRRYWISVVGVIILSQSAPTSWQVVKCISFHPSTAGITEKLITTALKDLHSEHEERAKQTPSIAVVPAETQAGAQIGATPSVPADDTRTLDRLAVSFGITAASHLHQGHNLGGWKVSVLSRTYKAVSGMAGLQKVTLFRKQFEATEEPMFICYPANRFGFLSIGPLLLALRK